METAEKAEQSADPPFPSWYRSGHSPGLFVASSGSEALKKKMATTVASMEVELRNLQQQRRQIELRLKNISLREAAMNRAQHRGGERSEFSLA